MKPYIITISRQFASMGRSIAQKMSSELGVNFVDRDIVAETAKRMGISISDVSSNEESNSQKNFLKPKHYFFNFRSYNLNDEIFEVQKNIIIDYANKGPCIIVGRCADWILKGRENTMNVYIYAPFSHRLHNCTHELMMEEKAAVSAIRQVDELRTAYRKRYCPDAKSLFDSTHLMIDSSFFGIEKTADFLCSLAKQKLSM